MDIAAILGLVPLLTDTTVTVYRTRYSNNSLVWPHNGAIAEAVNHPEVELVGHYDLAVMPRILIGFAGDAPTALSPWPTHVMGSSALFYENMGKRRTYLTARRPSGTGKSDDDVCYLFVPYGAVKVGR